MKHAGVIAVAIVYIALSLADGGYSPELIAAATIAIWWAVALGLLVGALPRARVPGTALVSGACLVGLAAWTALSLGWASDDGAAFIEIVRVLGYLGLFSLLVLASSRGSARHWLAGLAIGLTVVAGLALLSRFEPSFAGDESIVKFLPAAQTRLSYPIGYWSGVAACMAVASVLFAWFGAHAQTAIARAGAVGVLPLPILVTYLASSRGGVIAGVVGLIILLALGPVRPRLLGGLLLGGAGGAVLILAASRRHDLVDNLGNASAAQQGDQLLLITIMVVITVAVLRLLFDRRLGRLEVPRPVTVVTLVLILGGALIAVGAADPGKLYDDFRATPLRPSERGWVATHLTSGNGSGRYQFWGAALDAFESDPLQGIGTGGYEAWWNQHGSISLAVRDAHSLFFETMAELGVVGLALLLSFLGIAAVSGRARRARGSSPDRGAGLGVLGAGVVSASVDWTWELPACFGLVVVATALLTGPATEPNVGERGWTGAATKRPAIRASVGVVTVLLAGAAIWAGGLLFLTELKLSDSRDAVRRGDLSAAAQDARDASTVQPWAAEPRLQLALVEELGGDLSAASQKIDEAIDRAPEDWRPWFVKARLELKSGDVSQAKRALESSKDLNPRAPFLTEPARRHRTGRSSGAPSRR